MLKSAFVSVSSHSKNDEKVSSESSSAESDNDNNKDNECGNSSSE